MVTAAFRKSIPPNKYLLVLGEDPCVDASVYLQQISSASLNLAQQAMRRFGMSGARTKN
jgi:hypothetical protein